MRKKFEHVFSTDSDAGPDDPETTRMATFVVVFCIFAGPTVLTLSMLIAIHAEAIEEFGNSVAIFLYDHPPVAFTLMVYAIAGIGYFAYQRIKSIL